MSEIMRDGGKPIMAENDVQFLTAEEAIHEVYADLVEAPKGWIDFALFARVYGFLTKGEARPGNCEEKGSEFTKSGIWHQGPGMERSVFIDKWDFKSHVVPLIPKLKESVDDIAKIYEWVMWVKAIPVKGRDGRPGIHVETEMEKFQCVQCGQCCLDLLDAFCTSVDIEDIRRWKREDRWDILEWVDIFDFDGEEAFGDLWFSPNTGEEVNRCPWLRKLPLKDTYKCRIHETKPAHCRNYPKSKKHALTTGCKGFGNDRTFIEVKTELEGIYRVPNGVR